MVCMKGQVATEYLSVTAFVLVVVTVIFAFAYISYDQNIKTTRASDALIKMVSAADEVYLLGQGNSRFVQIYFPMGMQSLEVVNLCGDGTVEATDCIGHGGINSSALKMTVSLLGGNAEIIRESRAKLFLTNFPEASIAQGAGPFKIRVAWSDSGKVELRRV